MSDEVRVDPLSQIRHDMRTPINQILGYSELIEEEACDAGQQDLVPDLKRVQEAARNLLGMIDRFLGPDGLVAGLLAPGEAPAAEPRPRPAAEPEARLTRDETMPPRLSTAELPPPVQPTGDVTSSLLVVDDNEMNRDMLSRRLKSRSYEVATAEDGYQALEMLERDHFDLVLLDVMMPGISGLEVLQKVRQGSSRADLPVIMATARDTSEDIVEALKLGANDYVTKPLDFPVVLARVQSALSLKHATDEIQRLARHLEVRNQFIRNTFGRYLSDEIVESLLETPEGLALGGERRCVTILMSDLRGFTSLAERIPPEQVVGILNHYLGKMAEIILEHRGTIDEFIGDAILVIFGAPQVRDDDARRAVACAIAMQRAMAGVNEFNRSNDLPEVEMGIAIHTGEVVVGNIGSQKRAKYGVVGTPVNMTSRIESYSVGGQVLISEQTRQAAGDGVEAIDPIEIKAKGARQPLRAYELQSIGAPYDLQMPAMREEFRSLSRPIAVRFFRVEGKHVGAEAHEARLVRLSERSAEVDSDEDVPPLTNLRLEISGEDGAELPGDVYAKVVRPAADARGRFTIRFTARPPGLAGYLEQRWASASA